MKHDPHNMVLTLDICPFQYRSVIHSRMLAGLSGSSLDCLKWLLAVLVKAFCCCDNMPGEQNPWKQQDLVWLTFRGFGVWQDAPQLTVECEMETHFAEVELEPNCSSQLWEASETGRSHGQGASFKVTHFHQPGPSSWLATPSNNALTLCLPRVGYVTDKFRDLVNLSHPQSPISKHCIGDQAFGARILERCFVI